MVMRGRCRPEKRLASTLPPMAKTWRPMTVRRQVDGADRHDHEHREQGHRIEGLGQAQRGLGHAR